MEKNMHNDINNKEKDFLADLLREKLEQHRLPVDESSWAAIAAGIKAQKRRRLAPLWWVSTGAAAVVLLLISLQLFNHSSQFTVPMALNNANESVSQPESPAAKINESMSDFDNAANDKPSKPHERTNQLSAQMSTKLQRSFPNNELANLEQDRTQQSIAALLVSVDTLVVIANQLADIGRLSLKQIVFKNNFKQRADLKARVLLNQPDWEDPLTKTDKQDWALLASVGSSSGIEAKSVMSPSSTYYRQSSSIVKVPRQNTHATIFSPSDFAAKSYHAPLSFGLIADKKITKTLSLQSGVVYTYLLTDFQASSYSAKLNLHYLGVPLNLKLQLWHNKKWSVYASGGAMVEKGLKSTYVQQQKNENQLIETVVSTKIDGFQWSVQAATGITYNLYKEFDMYLEPKLSYHFDNKQPISTRTDKVLAVGLGAGVRFSF